MTATEPRLALGDSGESVLRLQARLHALNLFDEPLDGSFGDTTQTAVRALQEAHGLTPDGEVGAETWAALEAAEQAAGLPGPGADPAAPDPAAPDPAATPIGTLSEDQHWRWDGERWQPKDDDGAAATQAEQGSGHLSADGQWLWDGTQWQPVTQ
jgi:peptidoglycan hydrolase-like protein with peptidoglycan-binding domain